MTSPLVHIDGISKRFGDAIALEQLSLDIAEGEFVTFLGPSGCGKSTTLRILGGFEKPDTGSIILDGEGHNQTPARKASCEHGFPGLCAVSAYDCTAKHRICAGT